MKILSTVFLVATCGLGFFNEHNAQAKEKWVCKKDGTELKVKGKSPEDKQKSCEEQSGIWEKDAKGHGKKHDEKHDTEQTSGSGGSW